MRAAEILNRSDVPRGQRIWIGLASSLLALSLAGCGGSDSGGGGSGSTPITVAPTPTPTPAPTPAPTPTPSPTPTPTPTPTSWTAAAAALYDTQPNVASCNTGVLKTSVRMDMLAKVNAVRALHGLPAVVYAASANQGVDDSSLMMAANRTLDHNPPPTWTCYTTAGRDAAGSGNLIGGWGSLPWRTEDDLLAGWMTERNSASIGHRRWILNPFLGQIAYGRSVYQLSSGERADGATMKVFGFSTSVAAPAPSSLPDFIAYPQGNYPQRYFGASDILSFTVLANKTGAYGANGNVGFSGAIITVSSGGTSLPVTNVKYDNDGYGVPNNIEWRVTGLQANTTYTVKIVGITGAPQSGYEYTFRMVP
ncbi:CAP domain-containing protein [Sphingobium sp. B12D2B]|uniref:CAP domain-containing protein n=1 Tax=Sphingobium sp. B12D2B TaxID=2940577 RepID=UPI002224A129|nr:CAP domain-containing protein [Sphingobium sp. B12D2B]MCW2351379.1 uncharacterized protein YkwD [Sphingobium sp. B12D2B]